MAHDPISGPLSRSELRSLVDAPFGQARKVIQSYDPQWGREPGEKIKWLVSVRALSCRGSALVLAESKREAEELAEKLDLIDVDWDDGDIVVDSIVPLPRKQR